MIDNNQAPHPRSSPVPGGETGDTHTTLDASLDEYLDEVVDEGLDDELEEEPYEYWDYDGDCESCGFFNGDCDCDCYDDCPFLDELEEELLLAGEAEAVFRVSVLVSSDCPEETIREAIRAACQVDGVTAAYLDDHHVSDMDDCFITAANSFATEEEDS